MLAYNLYLLCKYHSIFNGRKIIFAVEDKEDKTLVDQLHLTWMFNDTHDIRPYELIMVPKGQDEGACLSKMLEMVQSDNSDEISFFAHAKDTSLEAASRNDVDELSDWVEVLYRNNLSDPALVDSVLSKYPSAGTLKYTACHPLDSYWSYGGNFFWFNHRELFSKKWKDYTSPIDEYISDKFDEREVYNFGEDYVAKKRAHFVVRNWDPSKVTIVTTCKNRWEFLKQSLPTWLNRGFKEIIIVDWSSNIEIVTNIEQMSIGSNLVTVIRVNGEDIFNGGMARNTGAKHVTSDYVLFIDADMIVKNWQVTKTISMVPGRFYHGPHNIPPFGTSLVRIDDFRKINGYSELCRSYGWEDNDLYNRLDASGLQRRLYDDRMVEHIDHSDELRIVHRDQRGKKLHETVWENKELELWTPNHKQADKPHLRYEFKI
jgi:hypothetical protein